MPSDDARMPLDARTPQDSSRRYATPAALLGWATTAVVSSLTVAIRLIGGAPIAENRFHLSDTSIAAMVMLSVAFASVGALVAARRPHNPVGWLLVVAGLVHAVSIAAAAYFSVAIARGPAVAMDAVWAAWLAEVASYLAGNAIAWTVFVFPDGRVPVADWRRWRWPLLAGYGLLGFSWLIRPGELLIFPQIENPLAVPPAAKDLVEVSLLLMFGLAAVLSVPVVRGVVARVRNARGTERQQLKWFGLAGLIWLPSGPAVAAAGLLAPGALPFGELPLTVFALSATLIPIAIGIAILRHRLYDIDLIIRRTLTYSVLTLALAGLYVGLVLLLQSLLAPFTAENSFAVAASTLAVAALFRPARERIQNAVDRRFYRSRYDAALTVEAFGARLREQFDLERLTEELSAVAEDAVRPASVSVWLRRS